MPVILTPVASVSGSFSIYGNVQIYTIQYILTYYVFILLLYETGELSENRYQQGTVKYPAPVYVIISRL